MKKTVYLTPHTHYDVVWAFTKEDYFLIFVTILRDAIRMIRESDFRFLIEQTYPLEMLELRNPRLFADVEEFIKAGKIEMVDSQYLMADPMSPGGEVLVREILFGKRYSRDKFGVDVPVAWAADGFGLNAQLPQIYAKSGYRWLAFRRGLPNTIGSRISEFLWEGLDGTKIPTHWMPLGYRAGLHLGRLDESYEHLSHLATTEHILMPCGSGGALPQKETPAAVADWNARHDDALMLIATPGDYFRAFDRADKDLTTFQGELYSDDLESIFPDVASSRIRLRLAIRDCEHLLLMAEKAAAIASLHGRPYPSEKLDDMWRKKLFLAMHDVVPGCGIDEIYDEAWDYIHEMRRTLPGITRSSVYHLMRGTKRSMNLVVFNPNNWTVRNWVEADVYTTEGDIMDLGVATDGKETPNEIIHAERWDDNSMRKARIGFMAEAPPMGCRSYRVIDKKGEFRSDMTVDEKEECAEVETPFFTLSVDRRTGIVTVKDGQGNLLLSGNEIIIDEEIGDLYFHKSQLDRRIGSESGEGLSFGVFKPGELTVNKGPVRTVVSFDNRYYCLRWPYYLTEKFKPTLYRHNVLELTKRISVYRDLPRIDFETFLHLHQPHVRIRLRFDSHMVAPRYGRQTQFGVLELPLEKTLEACHKIPSLTWVHCQEHGRGLAFMAQGVPINEITGGEIYCTLLRSVSVLSADGVSGPLVPTPKAQELGEHLYSYSVYPYTGDWTDAAVHRRAYETSQPLSAYQVDREPEQSSCHLFELEPDNLIVSALKQAEDGDGLILRFFETTGRPCRARLKVPGSVTRVAATDLLERAEAEHTLRDGAVELDVSPFEIVTLKLEE